MTTSPSSAARSDRHRPSFGPGRLAPTTAYWLMAAVIGLSLFASVTPTPIYHSYSELWDLSPFVITGIFAVYAIGVLLALIVAGRLSDDVGRRPVLIGSLSVLIIATLLFVFAQSVEWLFVGRALQGLATGVALGAASAALLDLHPRGDAGAVGLANGVSSAIGMGLGMVVSSFLVVYAPEPRHTPFLVVLVIFVVLLVGTWLMPEPVADRRRLALRVERPSVPRGILRVFALAALAVIASWSIGGLFMSLGPGVANQLLHTDSQLAGAAAVAALTVTGALSQLVFRGVDAWNLMVFGTPVLALGAGAIVLTLSLDSGPLFLLAMMVAGTGWGTSFLGALRALSAVIPSDHRASVMSAFYVVAYLSLSIPALAAGLVVDSWGLLPTFRVFGLAVMTIAVIVSVEAARTRPGRKPVGGPVGGTSEAPSSDDEPAVVGVTD